MDVITRYQPTSRLHYFLLQFLRGFKDCICGILALKDFNQNAAVSQSQRHRRKHQQTSTVDKSKLKKSLLYCFFLNGILFGLSTFLFYEAFLPCVRYLFDLNVCWISAIVVDSAWSYLANIMSLIFSAVWVMPLFLLSRLVNFLWFQDIADLTYEIPAGAQTTSIALSYVVVDMLGSFCTQVLFVIQSGIFYHFPYGNIGYPLHILHSCLLYSLYAFEYKWIKSGIQLNQRLAHIELNWAYYLGFGMPLTVLTSLVESRVISICIFSVLFPTYIISGNNTKPPPTVSLYSFRLPIFALATSLSDFLFSKLSGIFKK